MGGYASWFVAALIVMKLIFMVIRNFIRTTVSMLIICLFFISLGLYMTSLIINPYPWFINYALVSLIYLVFGYIYKKFESKNGLNNIKSLCIIGIIYIAFILMHSVLKFSYIYDMNMSNFSLVGSMIYFPISVIGVFFIVNLCKILPKNIKLLTFVGKNSLVFYFLNGAIITTLSSLFNKLNFNFSGSAIVMFIIVVCLLIFCSLFINRFLPWMVGLNHK